MDVINQPSITFQFSVPAGIHDRLVERLSRWQHATVIPDLNNKTTINIRTASLGAAQGIIAYLVGIEAALDF